MREGLEHNTSSAHNDNAGTPNEASPGEALREWKRNALENFSQWLEELDEMPPEGEATEPEFAPDLFSFYEELAALRNEVRKANRRTADTFSHWGESLEQYGESLRSIQEVVAGKGIQEEPVFSQGHCLALVELHDRLSRLGDALAKPPARGGLFGAAAQWKKAWDTVRQGVSIVRGHAENLLLEAGVRPIRAERQPFDPGSMVAVAVEADADVPPNTVVEVVADGYERAGEVLRPAEVKVTPR
ncbi:MAG: nucleotide exchange factor GrpE [Opitutales bacterium]